jgi:hypothetical protein
MTDYDWKSLEGPPLLASDKSFDEAMAQKLLQMTQRVPERLNREMFMDGISLPVPRPGFLTRARRYFSTLWQAIRGDDPYDVDGY